MAAKPFPRTEVGGISLPRILIGTNWLLGWSHTSSSADAQIRDRYQKPEDFFPVLEAYAEYDIDAIMGIFSYGNILEGVRYAEERLNRPFTLIDTPGINVDDSKEGRAAARSVIHESAQNGAKIFLIHHTSVEQLVNKNLRAIPRLPDYLYMIREEGMIPGLSAHMPECVRYSDENEYDVETYIQIFNCAGFLMQVEVENVARMIQTAKKPVMTIKSMAAGRVTPYVGLTFNWNVIRPWDMITLGVTDAREVHEDVEISMAALEHRFPGMEARNSPVKQDILGHK